jgi:stage III sporulation protein AH
VNDPSTNVGTNDGDGTANDGSTAVDGYFSATQVSRQRARDEALEVLQSVVDSTDADEATKTAALTEIAELADAMEAEANIETLVLAKGFAQCVAVINGESCSVVVNSEGQLQPAQISQINEIVYEQAGIQPVNVKIITK